MKKRTPLYYVVAAVATLGLAACGSSSSSTPASTTTTSSGSSSNAVPSDVAIASPTASTSASSSISVGKGLFKATGDPTTNSYADKKAATEALQAGTGTCAFTPSLTLPSTPTCYGPIIRFANHADGASGQPTLPPFDTGFWSLTEGASNEACAASQMNYLVDAVATRVEMMFNMFDMMVCVSKKAGIAEPSVGSTANLKDTMSSHGSVSGITVNTATIERLANSAAGNPVYKSTLSVTITAGGETRTGTAILKNEVTGTDANGKNNYKGKLSMTMSNPTQLGNNCGTANGAADAGSVMAGVVKYVKTSATSVKYEYNYAEFCGSTSAPLDTDNNISRTDVFSGTNTDGWGSNWNYGIFDLNPSNGTGNVAYAWQAGNGDQRTRVMNITTTANSDGSASGTAWYGFGPDVNGTGTLGSIDGFVCNWAGPNGAINSNPRTHAALLASTPAKAVTLAQKQILSRASGASVFTTTAANSAITYAPANSCNKTSANSTFTFVAETQSGTVLTQTNNVSDTSTVTNNLVALPTSAEFTQPSSVEDVGS